MKASRALRLHLEKKNARDRMKARALRAIAGETPNRIAKLIALGGDRLLRSEEWRLMRRKVLETYGLRCMKCGFDAPHPGAVNVDHIRPRCYWPELALDFENLQVLCPPCNEAKGNGPPVDYRPTITPPAKL